MNRAQSAAGAGQWSRYQRALKQRNAALRAGGQDVALWDPVLIEAGNAITSARQGALDRLKPYLMRLFEAFSGLAIDVGFNPGWGVDRSLGEQLRLNLARDRERGVTHSGPHRADAELRMKGRVAREILSRGQQKLTAVAMIVSQLQLLRTELGMRATLPAIVRRIDCPRLSDDRDLVDARNRAFSST